MHTAQAAQAVGHAAGDAAGHAATATASHLESWLTEAQAWAVELPLSTALALLALLLLAFGLCIATAYYGVTCSDWARWAAHSATAARALLASSSKSAIRCAFRSAVCAADAADAVWAVCTMCTSGLWWTRCAAAAWSGCSMCASALRWVREGICGERRSCGVLWYRCPRCCPRCPSCDCCPPAAKADVERGAAKRPKMQREDESDKLLAGFSSSSLGPEEAHRSATGQQSRPKATGDGRGGSCSSSDSADGDSSSDDDEWVGPHERSKRSAAELLSDLQIKPPTLQLPTPGDPDSARRHRYEPRVIPPKLELPTPGRYQETGAPPVPRGKAVAPLELPAQLEQLREEDDENGTLAPRSHYRPPPSARGSSCGALTSRSSCGGTTARGGASTDMSEDEEESQQAAVAQVGAQRMHSVHQPQPPSPSQGRGVDDFDDDGLLLVRCKIVRDGQFNALPSARRRPGHVRPSSAAAADGGRRPWEAAADVGGARGAAADGREYGSTAPRCARVGTLSSAGIAPPSCTPCRRSTGPPSGSTASRSTQRYTRATTGTPAHTPADTPASTRGAGATAADGALDDPLSAVARRQRERQSQECAVANRRTQRANDARRRLAEAEAASTAPRSTPRQQTPKAAATPKRTSIGSRGRAADSHAGGSSARHPPVSRPEEIPEARETMAALRARRRQLAKEIEALGETGAGDTFGRQRYARTRLVTIRLVDERLAAEGQTPEHRDVVRLAAAADLRHAEVLTWPGGLRVVFSEELISIPAASGAEADAQLAVAASRLQGELRELHGQQMGFFLALLDARLGFDTAGGASVQRQAEKEHTYHQVPLPSSSLPSASSAHFVYPATSVGEALAAEEWQVEPDELSYESSSGPRGAGGPAGGSVYSALARVFEESRQEGPPRLQVGRAHGKAPDSVDA